jgi:phosphoserine phosphatase RsbU/P
MDPNMLQRFRYNLVEQRQNLVDWLARAPAGKKQVRLGPADEQAVQTRLQVLDTTIAKAEDQTLGLCEVCFLDVEPSRLEIDYTTCVCLDHLSDEAKRDIENELELAAKVQQALLPQQIPQIPGLELAVYSRPASVIGGDYFDFNTFRDGAHGLVIGDAVGHGISASLLMSNLHASLRILIPDHNRPAEVIRRVNQLFYHNINLTNFVTLFLGRFDPETFTLTYSSAGHNPALLFRPQIASTGMVSWLQPTGAAIGLVEVFEMGTATVSLRAGDVLLLYTDGVTEATDPQEVPFGLLRLADVVQQRSDLSVQDLIQALRESLQAHTQGQPLVDDTTIIAVKVVGG